MDVLLCSNYSSLPDIALSVADITDSSGVGNKHRLNPLIGTIWVRLIQVDAGIHNVNDLVLLLWHSLSCATTVNTELIFSVATRARTDSPVDTLLSPSTE